MVKSEEEIARLRRAAEINEKAAMKSLSNVKPGVSAREISQIYSESIVKEGALPFYAIHSRSGTSVTTDLSYRFRRGETVFFDFSCIYEMYYADTGNTVMVGEVSSNSVKVYRWLGDALSLALKEVKPGAKPSALMEIMRSSLAERGISQTGVQGHGIGLEARDYPAIGALSRTTLSDGFIEANTDIPLEEGMVINLETPYYPFGKGSFQIERTVVVTTNGFSDVTPQDRESPVLGV